MALTELAGFKKPRSVAAPVTTSMSNHSVGVLTNCTMAVVHSRGASTVSWLKFCPLMVAPAVICAAVTERFRTRGPLESEKPAGCVNTVGGQSDAADTVS